MRPFQVELRPDGWWSCENPYDPPGPGHGANLLLRRHGGAWVLGWEGDVYSQRSGVTDLHEALDELVVPAEPNRAWMGGLIELLEAEGLWPPSEVHAEFAGRKHRVARRQLTWSERELLEEHGGRGLDLSAAAKEINISAEHAGRLWIRLRREAEWLAGWRDDGTDRPKHGAWLDDTLPPDSFIVEDVNQCERFCPDRDAMLGETARLAGTRYFVRWRRADGQMAYADSPLPRGWGSPEAAAGDG